MNRKRVTIKDIAAKALVSASTVSRVMNKSGFVDDRKKQAVLKAMSDLDYQPNAVARSLVMGKTNTVGVITQDIGSQFYDSISEALNESLRKLNYSSIIAESSSTEKSVSQAVQDLVGRNVDGIIVITNVLEKEDLDPIHRKKPTIVIAKQVAGWEERNLFIDNFTGAYQATEHLIQLGHQNIALLGGRIGHQDSARRIEGYRAALADNGIEYRDELFVQADFIAPAGTLATDQLLARGIPFSAIFCCNDESAFGVRLALWKRGLRVPEDVSIIGFDDHRLAAFMTPPLTTVRQPLFEMGSAAAQMMIRHLNGEEFGIPEFKTELVIRESVARINGRG